MNKSLAVVIALAVGGLALGACASAGNPATLTTAELASQCEAGGGVLTPRASPTRPVGQFVVCSRDASHAQVPGRSMATTQLNQAITQSQRGY